MRTKEEVSARKARLIEIWLSNPMASYEEICRQAGCSNDTFLRYRKDEEFMKEYSRRCKERFSSLEAKAVAKLEEQIDNDNFAAIKYALDGLGYKPDDNLNVSGTNTFTITIEGDE